MTRHRVKMAMAVGAVALVGYACSSEPAMTIDTYADAAASATSAYVDESQQLSLTYQKLVEREVGKIVESGSDTAVADATTLVRTETVKYLALLDDAILRYVEAMDGLAPPGQVEEAHDAYIVIVESVQMTLPGMREAVGAASSIPQIQEALVGSGFSDGQTAWLATCSTLEQAVRDAGRGVDLKCVKPDVVPGDGSAP